MEDDDLPEDAMLDDEVVDLGDEDDDDGESNRVDAARVASARVVAACTPDTNGRKTDHRLAGRVSDAEDRAMASMQRA